MQTSDVRSPILTQTHVIGLDLTVVSSKLDVKCGYLQSALKSPLSGARLGSSRIVGKFAASPQQQAIAAPSGYRPPAPGASG